MTLHKALGIGVALALLAGVAMAESKTGIDAEAQLPYWEIAEQNISIRLVQRLPDQTRGFFEARGFAKADAETIAQSCVFQTVFKNLSTPAQPVVIDYDLKEWRVQAGAAQRRLKTREDWQREWAARGIAQSARMAFEWALLPTRQTYHVGDYNWGMSVYDLKPGTRFALDVIWRENGKPRRAGVDGVRCAPDTPAPEALP